MKKNAYIVLLLAFLGCYYLVSPAHLGDTTRYAPDVVKHFQGRQAQFWEFGHLLWRPWGYAGYSVLGGSYERWFGGTASAAAARFLIQTNLVCSIAVLFLTLVLLRKVAREWVAAVVAVAMSCSISFLFYSHSGAPYIPALMFSVLTLLFIASGLENAARGRVYALLAGLSFAIACALWFPYSFSGLGMLAALYLWPMREPVEARKERELRRGLMATFVISLALATAIMFGGGAVAEGIRSAGQLSQWVLQSDNGWSQSKTAMRAITGLARSMWDFGGETVLLKRWLFHDPYNPARIWTVVFTLGAKLALFYLGVVTTLWVLWKERRGFLTMLLAAVAPLLFFAIFLFEPSSSERFLPAFPFAFLAFAIVLDKARSHTVPAICVTALLVATAVFNVAANNRVSAQSRFAAARQRICALDGAVQPGALVTVLTFNDDLIRLHDAHPLDNSLRGQRFGAAEAVLIAMDATGRWRGIFAERTEKQWSEGKEAWISERLLARRPEAAWLWVEGDDPRIRWSDLPAAFSQLETDRKIDLGGDGFLRVAQTQANRDLLAKWLAADAMRIEARARVIRARTSGYAAR